MTLRIGIDTGGTFTDVVAVTAGEIVSTKTPSNPDDPAAAVMDALTKVLALVGRRASDVTALSHGTTVATNTLLEEDFTGLGLLTTEGYRAVLEIARQSVPDGYGNSYFWTKPERIVPLHLVGEAPGRLDHTGIEVHPLDREAVTREIARLREAGVTTLAVSLLHSYADPSHEEAVREVVRRAHPGCSVSLSSEVLREYREHERTLTTCVDAAVKPRIAAYLTGLHERLAATVDAPFGVMTSSGGIASAARAAARPIATLLSGPAAGAVGAGVVAGWAGHEHVLTLDGGGTSTDVGVVHDGRPTVTAEGRVGRFAVRVPMVDVVTVGTGGGSVGWLSPEGRLKVGPRSAGALPGPMCYGRGGVDPTLTDAHLLLGRIPPQLLGGEIDLDVAAATAGIDRLAVAVGLERTACAAGMLEIAAWNQANAIRQVTVKRGIDLRDLTLVAFGGSGPLQACRLLDLLGLPRALVPPDPGNLSAFGLLTVAPRADELQTHVRRADRVDRDELAQVYAALEARANQALSAEGHEPTATRLLRAADLRYHGQATEVQVPAPGGPIDADFIETTVAAFHDAHERRYGYCYRDSPSQTVEWVNLRVTALGPDPQLQPPALPRAPAVTPPRAGTRAVFFDGRWHDAPTVARPDLLAGHVVVGPAVVEEFGSTLPLAPGFTAQADGHGNLVVARS